MSNTALSLGSESHKICGAIICKLAEKYRTILPILATPLNRFYTETCDFQSLIDLRNRIHEQENKESLEKINGYSLFMAFGHQIVYPYHAYVANLEWDRNYQITYDPDLCNNSLLAKLQLVSGYPLVPERLTSKVEPNIVRAWPPTIGIHFPSIAADTVINGKMSHDYLTTYFSKCEKSIPPSLDYNSLKNNYSPKCSVLKAIKNSKTKFIAVQWRTDLYKGETTNYNLYRNSQDSNVLHACHELSISMKVNFLILNKVNIESEEFHRLNKLPNLFFVDQTKILIVKIIFGHVPMPR